MGRSGERNSNEIWSPVPRAPIQLIENPLPWTRRLGASKTWRPRDLENPKTILRSLETWRFGDLAKLAKLAKWTVEKINFLKGMLPRRDIAVLARLAKRKVERGSVAVWRVVTGGPPTRSTAKDRSADINNKGFAFFNLKKQCSGCPPQKAFFCIRRQQGKNVCDSKFGIP